MISRFSFKIGTGGTRDAAHFRVFLSSIREVLCSVFSTTEPRHSSPPATPALCGEEEEDQMFNVILTYKASSKSA